jgi:hypothetical protein
MKKLMILIVLISFFACKKEEVDPPVVTPDYADSLVGTYVGTEVHLGTDNMTQEYNNGSKTMTVTKISKNKIQLSSFYNGGSPFFNLSDDGAGTIILSPESFTAYGNGNNRYILSSKSFSVYLKDSFSKYKRFYGTKQ